VNIVAVYNIKGGVGKTSTAVNLAYLSAREGRRTLLWDLDPQAAATYLFRVRPRVKGGGHALVTRKRPIEAARGAIVDVLGAGLLAQFGDPQPCCEPLVLPPRDLSIDEKSEPFERAETIGLPACGEILEGLGHSLEAERVELVEGRMLEQGVSPNCSSAAHGCLDAGSAFRPWGACARDADPGCGRGSI